MLRVLTKTSKRLALQEWISPPPYVMNNELRRPHIERVLFGDGQEVAEGAARLGLAEEARLFKQLHYCGYRLSRLYKSADRHGPDGDTKRSYDEWAQRYQSLRTRIIEANLGLVYDSIRRNRFSNLDRDQMCSEGMLALLRAADTFDPWRGFHFSTYACNAIARAFSRAALQESKRHSRFPSSFDTEYEPVDRYEIREASARAFFSDRLQQVMDPNNPTLRPVEKCVLLRRFPLEEGCRPQTLEDIGREIQLSKERVRQIQITAIAKLRRVLVHNNTLR